MVCVVKDEAGERAGVFQTMGLWPKTILFEVLLCVLAKVGVESKSRLFKSCELLFQRQLMGLWLKVKLLCVLCVSDNGIAVKDETGVFFVFQPMGLRPKTRLSDFTIVCCSNCFCVCVTVHDSSQKWDYHSCCFFVCVCVCIR